MGQHSKIEWTDHTFNPWRGCTHAVLASGAEHPGCAHCYAEAMAPRNPKTLGTWGPEGTRVVASEAMWRQPLAWNAAAEAAGVRARVFCASLADVFEDWPWPVIDAQGRCVETDDGESVQGLNGLRRRLFALIDQTPWLDWQIVTKRPGNVRRMWPVDPCCGVDQTRDCGGRDCGLCGGVGGVHNLRPNVWLLTSVSNQQTADELIPELLGCRDLVPVLGLSCEPLLGPIDASPWLFSDHDRASMDRAYLSPLPGTPEADGFFAKIDWVIAGGESGHHARPMHPDWARSLRDQCEAAGVPFFFKQWGEWLGAMQDGAAMPDGSKELNCSDESIRVGKAAAGRDLDGREWSEFPAVEATRA